MEPATKQVVNIPNNELTTYTFKGQIPASPVLSKKAQDKNVFKYLHSAYIISLWQLWEDGCTAILNKQFINVVKGTNLVLSEKDKSNEWYVGHPFNFPSPTTFKY